MWPILPCSSLVQNQLSGFLFCNTLYPINQLTCLLFNQRNRTGILNKLEDLKNRCMDGLIKRIVSVLLYSIRRQRKSLCRKSANKKMIEFVSAGKCINAGRPEAEKCFRQALDHIVGIKHVEDKMKIPYICWYIYQVKKIKFNFSNIRYFDLNSI